MIREWATRTFSGRAIALGAIVKIVAFLLTAVAGSYPAFEALDTVGDIGLVSGALVLGYHLFVDAKRRLLWRVRRKLTISYIFIGFVPALLIITFFLLCGLLVAYNLSAHLINRGLREVQGHAELLAEMASVAVDNARTDTELQATLAQRQAVAAARYPGVSYAVIPAPNPCAGPRRETTALGAPATAGPWAHVGAPTRIPAWVECGGHAGLMYYTEEARRSGTRAPGRLVIRVVVWPPSRANYASLVDVPITNDVARRLREDTGIELMEMAVVTSGKTSRVESVSAPGAVASSSPPAADEPGGLFRRRFGWLTFLDSTEWESGALERLTVGIRSSVADLYARINQAEQIGDADFDVGQVLIYGGAIVGILFLVIQLVAFGMGLGLARSITGAVHELFEGTERVRRGDFGGEITVRSRDQMGQLAESFNEMTASIEDLLQQKAEKERLEQELLIARRIQMSLLPQGQTTMAGITLTAHCEPAREVGGDYYDFLPIDDHTIGILIADVSGKGTSAALYMAELKGIVLSLSQRHTSPRELLIEADRIISRHLDSQSFITVSYLLVDVRTRTVRYARAGHCPMIYVPGTYASLRAPQLLTPDGLVLGLQLDEGRTFTRLLEEMTLPLGPGDLFVLYTDGMSEAMNPDGDCFGDARLADLIGAHADLPAEELRERILRDLDAFAGTAAQHDDMTMVLLRVDEMAV